jgi:hypothetical protein
MHNFADQTRKWGERHQKTLTPLVLANLSKRLSYIQLIYSTHNEEVRTSRLESVVPSLAGGLGLLNFPVGPFTAAWRFATT